MKPTNLVALVPALLCSLDASPSTAASPRLPLQMDFDRCTLAIEDQGRAFLQGRLRMELLVRRTGEVYGSFIHSDTGVDDKRLERCLVNTALLWRLPEVAVDYQRPYVVTFAAGTSVYDFSDASYGRGDGPSIAGRTSAFMPDVNQPAPAAPVDATLAQATLELSETASEAERGIAELAVQRPERALPALRTALERNSTDPVALRGLAQALVDSQGDLAEARKAAAQLVSQEPGSVAGHEAMLRVCLASGDDECAFAQWKAARAAADLPTRSRSLSELQEQAQAAATRLAALAQVVLHDACGDLAGEDAQALCVLKRCLDQGTVDYARELSEQNHSVLTTADWTSVRVGAGQLVVTRPIASADGSGARHDALWLVKIKDQLTFQPASSEAVQITLRHNRCGSRILGSR